MGSNRDTQLGTGKLWAETVVKFSPDEMAVDPCFRSTNGAKPELTSPKSSLLPAPPPPVSPQKSDLRFSYAVYGLVIVARMPFAPPSPNRVPGETEARALKALLQHDISLRLQLEQQQLHRQGQAESADRSAASLRECGTRAELVQAIYREMVEVTNKLIAAIELATQAHDQAADMMETLSSAPRARNAFSTMSDALKTILIDSEPPIVAIKSHTHLIDVECKAFELIGVSAKQSLSLVDLSLDAITAGIEEKKGLLHPIRRVPSEVLENIFIEFVEDERDRLRRDFQGTSNPWRGLCISPRSFSLPFAIGGAVSRSACLACGPTFAFQRFRPCGALVLAGQGLGI